MLKNGFDLAPSYTGEPFEKFVDRCAVFDVVKQSADRHTSSLKDPSSADTVWVLLNTSAVGPLNHHVDMLPPRCGKLNRDFISRPNAHNQAPRVRVRAPPKVACIVMFGNQAS